MNVDCYTRREEYAHVAVTGVMTGVRCDIMTFLKCHNVTPDTTVQKKDAFLFVNSPLYGTLKLRNKW